MLSSKKIVDGYLQQQDWRVKENSNAPFCYGALGQHAKKEVFKDYWLREVYTKDIVEAYREGAMHLHDLGELTIYCCGYSLKKIIEEGVHGIYNIPKSAPAKHFGAILAQLANVLTVFQNEIAGAVAFSSFDTLLAPFVYFDSLSYKQVKQHIQSFVFQVNSNSRGGAEPAFSNITCDLTPPSDLLNQPVLWNGEYSTMYQYGDFQEQMDMINRAFFEIILEGDADGQPFSYPIPTYNIHKRFDWNNPNNDLLWEMAGKRGTPYFANFINSDMNPEDARSMCCRLRLDKRELLKRNGGLFGSGDSTGSIGVVTINLPRIAYLAKDEFEAYEILDVYLELAKKSLEIKRTFLQEEIIDKGLLPAYSTYIGTMANHFSTIGYIGLNEFCENLIGENILTDRARDLSVRVLEHMRKKIADYQVETGNLYNLEATPAESTCYRLAAKDLEMFPDISHQGTKDAPYYTNSCHIPVKLVKTFKQVAEHQDALQKLHTGGTVIHYYLNGPITAEQAKQIIKVSCEETENPYFSLSPVTRYCPTCGYIEEKVMKCPKCGKELDVIQRITGYPRKVKYFNPGKYQEFLDRAQLEIDDHSL